MEKSTRAGIRTAGICAIIASTLQLAGCGTAASVVRTKSETELQVSAIRAEWLKRCEAMGPPPENQVGALLQDYADMSAIFAECMQRHNSLVEHLTPIVKKERETPANP